MTTQGTPGWSPEEIAKKLGAKRFVHLDGSQNRRVATEEVLAPRDEPIKIIVTCERCMGQYRVRTWNYESAPPHVLRFIRDDKFGDVCSELARLGYAFSVTTKYEDISLFDWQAYPPIEKLF